jgi:hypothetical protein
VTDVGQLKKTATALTKQSLQLGMARSALEAPDVERGPEFLPVIQRHLEDVNSAVNVVNSAINRQQRFDQNIRNITARRPGAEVELLKGSQRISDVPNAVNQLAKGGPVYILDNDGGVKQVDASAAVQQLANNSTLHVTSDNRFVLKLELGQRQLSPTERSLITSFQAPTLPRIDMAKINDALNLRPEELGGIDLNPSFLNMQIKRDGNGVILPVSQQPLDIMNIQGFVPIITDVSPATPLNMPLILGQVETTGEDVLSVVDQSTAR